MKYEKADLNKVMNKQHQHISEDQWNNPLRTLGMWTTYEVYFKQKKHKTGFLDTVTHN